MIGRNRSLRRAVDMVPDEFTVTVLLQFCLFDFLSAYSTKTEFNKFWKTKWREVNINLTLSKNKCAYELLPQNRYVYLFHLSSENFEGKIDTHFIIKFHVFEPHCTHDALSKSLTKMVKLRDKKHYIMFIVKVNVFCHIPSWDTK